MTVRSSEIAARELDDILAYIHQDNPTAAEKLSIAIFAYTKMVSQILSICEPSRMYFMLCYVKEITHMYE